MEAEDINGDEYLSGILDKKESISSAITSIEELATRCGIPVSEVVEMVLHMNPSSTSSGRILIEAARTMANSKETE